MSKSLVKVALVGVGPHSEASWLPALRDLKTEGLIGLTLALDIDSDAPQKRLADGFADTTFLQVDGLDRRHRLSVQVSELLSRHREDIDLLIVATEPKSHVAYAQWGAQNDKHVIVDKPLSTRPDSITDPDAARGIYADWRLLEAEHARHKHKLMAVNAHRRFEPAYVMALDLLQEVRDSTGVGLTYAYLQHSDGQWRTPNEIDSIGYHGYLDGTGKIGHSGYHFIDYWSCAVAAATPQDKLADQVSVTSVLHQPDTYLRQVDGGTNSKFLEGYKSEAVQRASNQNYGEVDAFASASLLKDGLPSSHMQLSLMHSGLSQRTAATASEDLYKSNGRVRQVLLDFYQGPFQRITVTSNQSYQPSEENPINDISLGGARHLDVTVWRNKQLGDPAPQIIRGFELLDGKYEKRLMHEQVKASILEKIIKVIRGSAPLESIATADISQHQVAPAFASAMYLSNQIGGMPHVIEPRWPTKLPTLISKGEEIK